MTPQETTDRCPACGSDDPGTYRSVKGHVCTDPWHTQETTDPEDVLHRLIEAHACCWHDGHGHGTMGCDGEGDAKVDAALASLRAEARTLRNHGVNQAEANDSLMAEVSKLSMLVTTLRGELAEALAIAHDALEVLGPCDEDNPHVEVWCIRHQEKRCDVPRIRQRLAAIDPEEDR